MKRNLIRLSQRYLKALGNHLRPGRPVIPPGRIASGLGIEAAGLGLETLGLARIHEQALATLKLSTTQNGLTKRAGIFFAEANLPIEEMRHGAQQRKVQLSRMEELLEERTEELAVSNRQLKRVVARRKRMEEGAEQTGLHHQKCLEESLQLQKRLRQLTHRVLAAQENERTNISRELQNEIAQTLLGINVRLLALKQEGRGSAKSLKSEIASTQRLVESSAKFVRRVARKYGKL